MLHEQYWDSTNLLIAKLLYKSFRFTSYFVQTNYDSIIPLNVVNELMDWRLCFLKGGVSCSLPHLIFKNMKNI